VEGGDVKLILDLYQPKTQGELAAHPRIEFVPLDIK
jgi:hypothetical protein